MSQNKLGWLDWFGFRRLPDLRRARWLGGLISTLAILLLCVVAVSVVKEFLRAVWGDDPNGEALRNTGLVLAALIGVPFLVWRSVVLQKQADTAAESLFNDKINAAASDLHARRLVTHNPSQLDDRWEYYQDDIVKRNAAIDRLEGLVEERPDTAARVSRLLSVYVRELSRENLPIPVPEGACFVGANLQGSVLNFAEMKGADLSGTDLREADLSWSKIAGADISDAKMQGVTLTFSGPANSA